MTTSEEMDNTAFTCWNCGELNINCECEDEDANEVEDDK